MSLKTSSRWIAPLAGLLVLSGSAIAVRAEPLPASPVTQASPRPNYTVPARRPVHILRQDTGASLSALFDSASGNQAKVLNEMDGLQVLMNNDIAEAVEAYYAQPKAKLIWVDGKGPTPKAAQALSLLKQAEDWGLNAGDYGRCSSSRIGPRESTGRVRSLPLGQDADVSCRIISAAASIPTSCPTIMTFKPQAGRSEGDDRPTLRPQPDLMVVFDRLLPSNPKFAQLAAELHYLRTSGPGR
ncbi:hypothetical protein LVY75_24110 [Sinorhizobium sp. B11]